MSNETKDYLEEIESYNKAVYKDFLEQNPDYTTWDHKHITYEFINYLLSRMYHEGIPEKEPRG